MKTVILVSIFFLILFSAFSAFHNIVTQIHEEEGDRALGPFALAVNYTSYIILNLFAPGCKRISEKWQISLSALGYCFFYSSGFLIDGTATWVKYTITALSALINGVAGSFLWVSVGSYIHKVAHLYNQPHLKGKYYGIFNLFFSLSAVVGAIVVTFGLHLFSHSIYFALVGSIALLAFLFGVFFIKDLNKLHPTQESILSDEAQN